MDLWAITLWQPWASLVAIGAKPFEFRKWAAPRVYRRKRIAIHAGARPVRRDEVRGLLLNLRRGGWRETALKPEIATDFLESLLSAPGSLLLSAVVCTAVLGEPLRNSDLRAALFGDDAGINEDLLWEDSNWGWPLTEIEPIEPPEPVRGQRGFWRWRDRQQAAAGCVVS
ncbi:MAG: hypothetical protein ACREFP_24630 [Acetobacteraceae bacterium]